MRFVDVYDTRTGKKLPHPVPEHRVKHPLWGRNLSLTPSQRARETAPAEPPAEVANPVTTDDTETVPVALSDHTETPLGGAEHEE